MILPNSRLWTKWSKMILRVISYFFDKNLARKLHNTSIDFVAIKGRLIKDQLTNSFFGVMMQLEYFLENKQFQNSTFCSYRATFWANLFDCWTSWGCNVHRFYSAHFVDPQHKYRLFQTLQYQRWTSSDQSAEIIPSYRSMSRNSPLRLLQRTVLLSVWKREGLRSPRRKVWRKCYWEDQSLLSRG